jgi:hypothetical protein
MKHSGEAIPEMFHPQEFLESLSIQPLSCNLFHLFLASSFCPRRFSWPNVSPLTSLQPDPSLVVLDGCLWTDENSDTSLNRRMLRI